MLFALIASGIAEGFFEMQCIIETTMPKKATNTSPEVSSFPIHGRLMQLRLDRGLSQAEVAKALDLTQVLVSNYEQGTRRLHAELIARFAEFYKVSADDLLGLKTPSTPNKPSNELGLHLLKRMQKIQSLPKQRQKEVLRSIDFVLNGADC
jgi:transcriptional regulator with XRE-family HTH domain